ncbi:NADP-dependent 3-hydroxy acid dehydrogenase YdfG [Singulisphaera sp. GP187]|uniref:SDR family oxidoreductase n=1 Tax=Singulisphaera sp. GP187 TaxID=1882752 RepID=UPI000929E7FC|nr:SDR family oxidoreductase [Singulisphaera sp. GP187]SIO29629.1 NADP-dependent 3-hydroxy acid dehydrogenase YdfG [Singulisphaera sp. GP187]
MPVWESKIEGKVVVITGASSGIGEATARLLAARGAKVVLGARRVDRLEQIVAEIREAGGQALAHAVDVTKHEQVKALVAATVGQFGRIDVMINNAGYMSLSMLDADKVDEWDRTIDVNIKGVLYGISAALPLFRAQGSGHLINVSSVAGHLAIGGAAVYCGTKFAVRAISEAFRQEVAPQIRSTIISPGAVESELSSHVTDPQAIEWMKPLAAVKIPAEAIAQAILYAIEQPPTVAINELLVRPTAQTV